MFLYYVAIWPALYLLLNSSNVWYNSPAGEINDLKIKRNSMAFFHTCIAVTLSFLYYLYPDTYVGIRGPFSYNEKLFNFSYSYFIWDTYLISTIYFKKEKMFIYHHLVTLYILELIRYGPESRIINNIFMIGELSNLTFYPVYHYMKLIQPKSNDPMKDNYLYKTLKKFRIIQSFWYIALRFFIFSYFIYIYSDKISDKFMLYNLYGVYLLGVGWSFNNIKGVYLDYFY